MKININFRDKGSLCHSCQHAKITKDDSGNEKRQCLVFRYASGRSIDIKENIKECNTYLDKQEVPLYKLEEIAYVMEVKKGGVVGFRPPDKSKDE